MEKKKKTYVWYYPGEVGEGTSLALVGGSGKQILLPHTFGGFVGHGGRKGHQKFNLKRGFGKSGSTRKKSSWIVLKRKGGQESAVSGGKTFWFW